MTKLSLLKSICVLVMLCVLTAIASPAQTFTTLVSFDWANGAGPYYGSLIQGTDGNLYGATVSGGAGLQGDNGTIFEVTPTGQLSSFYSFCAQPNCLDGTGPYAGVIQGTDGSFYGTTLSGGANESCFGDGCGVVFRVTPTGTETTLHSFDGVDGGSPQAALIQATDGNFYGTTEQFGPNCFTIGECSGTVFKITPKGTLTTLYSFCSQPGCSDGSFPFAGLIQATDGNFYGTTYEGGAHGYGTVFRITRAGKLTRVHSFNVTDGAYPVGGLLQGSDGNLYGTTTEGGVNSSCYGGNGCGTVYRISVTGALTTLYSFCSQSDCLDGYVPYAALVQATDGNFYGTTIFGGGGSGPSSFTGTVFNITPTGALTTLYRFCSQSNCPTGSGPIAGLLQATDGNFYGTTYSGGTNNSCPPFYFTCGTVFRLSTGLGPFVRLVRDSGKVGQSGDILGQGFTGTTSVSFNGVPASFAVVSDTFLRATVPSGATNGYVTVTTPGGTLTSNVPFQVIQ